MIKTYGWILAVGFACATANPARADAAAANKNQYHLFKPTPPERMRELSTDRPDLTESPYTVDAGHFQIEWDFLSFSADDRQPDGGRADVETYGILPANFKVGLLNHVDLQLLVETYIIEHTKNPGVTRSEREGLGDITTRLKFNVWGNDGGDTALGIMPFVKFPTNMDGLGNNAVEGGVIIPFAMALPADWSLGMMTEFDLMEDGDGGSHHVDFINSITASHAIIGELGGYAELFTLVSTEDPSDWVASADFGLTYGVTENFQMDCGINVGLTRGADDYNPFIGAAVRF